LSSGVALAKAKLPDSFAAWTSRVSGIVLIGFGLAALASAVTTLIEFR
jgi:putative LysE/RhtB family amino acid efflux pump